MGAYNCLVKSLTVDGSCEEHFGLGTAKVTYILAGDVGNKSTCSFTVTVVDDTAPVIANCPGNVTVKSSMGDPTKCSQTAPWAMQASLDNSHVKILTGDHAPGDTFSLGTATVTYTAEDDAG